MGKKTYSFSLLKLLLTQQALREHRQDDKNNTLRKFGRILLCAQRLNSTYDMTRKVMMSDLLPTSTFVPFQNRHVLYAFLAFGFVHFPVPP